MTTRNELLEEILAATSSGSSKGGFIDYNDTATSITPITLPADTWTTITNDGLGVFSNDTYRPDGVTELYDVSTDQVDFSELALGDTVFIRNDFVVTPNSNNTLLKRNMIFFWCFIYDKTCISLYRIIKYESF